MLLLLFDLHYATIPNFTQEALKVIIMIKVCINYRLQRGMKMCVLHLHQVQRTSNYIPIYSAELHPSNRSKIVSRQLDGIKKALDVENKSLRLFRLITEVLNPYKHRWYTIRSALPDKTTKTYELYISSFDTTPMAENILYIVLIIVYGIFYIYHSWETVIKLKNDITLKSSYYKMISSHGPALFLTIGLQL